MTGEKLRKVGKNSTMKITTDKVTINNTAQNVFDFLADFNNFQQLLPQDKIKDYQSTKDDCSFGIKGMTELGMKIVDRKSPSEINITSNGKVPFPFKLNVFLQENGSTTIGHMEFEGDINPFMKMMVETPLTNFFGMLQKKLVEINQ